MWNDYEQDRLPRPDLSNLDVYLEVGSQIDHEKVEVQTIHEYEDWWTGMLAERHRFRPIPSDHRMVNASDCFQ
jgi:hypothetical protein